MNPLPSSYSFPSEHQLFDCIASHPVLGDTSSYFTKRKVTQAVVKAFADKKDMSSSEIEPRTTAAIRESTFVRGNPNISISLLAVMQMSFAQAIKDCANK